MGRDFHSRIGILKELDNGDNLGFYTILGFSETFPSNFYCRFQKQHRKIHRVAAIENIEILRNPENYNSDLVKNDFWVTGTKEKSVWNTLKGFHVTKNYCVDVMKEGVYYPVFVLTRFIKDHEFFNLNQLNYRMLTFNYGPVYSRNKPPMISSDFHKKLKLSASETLILGK